MWYIMPRPTVGGIKRCCGPSVRLALCLSVILILSRSLDGDMQASPFQTHSIRDSTVGYARIQMLSAGAYRCASKYLVILISFRLPIILFENFSLTQNRHTHNCLRQMAPSYTCFGAHKCRHPLRHLDWFCRYHFYQ